MTLWKTRTKSMCPFVTAPGASKTVCLRCGMEGAPSQVRGPYTLWLGMRPPALRLLSGGTGKTGVTRVFFGPYNSVIKSRGQGKKGPGEAKRLRLPWELHSPGISLHREHWASSPWIVILLSNPLTFPWKLETDLAVSCT